MLPDFSAGAVLYPAMVLADQTIHLFVYRDFINNQKATVKTLNGFGVWTTVGPPGISQGLATNTSAAIGTGDNLYVAFKDILKE